MERQRSGHGFEEKNSTSEIPTVGESPSSNQDDSDWIERFLAEGQASTFESRYQPLKRLGRGGTSEVYLMHDLRVGREVAAKVLRSDRPISRSEYARFLHEASHQARLEHPSIVPVHDVGLTRDGRVYFTMKPVRGVTLSTVLKRLRRGDAETEAQFTRHRLLSAFNTVCLTVAFAHERGFIHRDIKPSNIMLGDFGETYLLDWGISRDASPLPREGTPAAQVPRPLTHGTSGTPGYMAPEQIDALDQPLTAAVDIYALGCVLFEILSLEAIHPHRAVDAVLQSTLNGIDARPSVRAPQRDISPELDALCVRATALEPRARFATARDLSLAIERSLNGERDTKLREALAEEQLESAEVSLQRAAGAGAADETRLLADAVQSAGRALALEPRNERALECLLRVIGHRPRATPPEIEETLARRTRAALQLARRRWALFGALFMLTLLPAAFWLGIRDLKLVGAGFGAAGFFVATLAVSSLRKESPAWMSHLHLFAAQATCFLAGLAVSSVFFSPSLFMLSTMGFAMGPIRSLRTTAIALGCLGSCLVFGLEAAGLVSPSFEFTGTGLVCLVPQAVHFSPAPFVLTITALCVLLTIAPALLVMRLRESEERAERQVLLSTWYLRQLLPRTAVSPASA